MPAPEQQQDTTELRAFLARFAPPVDETASTPPSAPAPAGAAHEVAPPPIDAAAPVNLQPLIDAVVSLRAAATQIRLYPAQSAPVRLALSDAIETIDQLWGKYPHLILSQNSGELGLNGYGVSRQVQRMLQDLQRQLQEASLIAFTMRPGVTAAEIEGFLFELGTYNPDKDNIPFIAKIARLNLEHIQVVPREHFGQPAAQPVSQPTYAQPPPAHEIPSQQDEEAVNLESWANYRDSYTAATTNYRRRILASLAQWLDRQIAHLSDEVLDRVDGFLQDVTHDEEDPVVLREALNVLDQRLRPLLDNGKWEKVLTQVPPVVENVRQNPEPEVQQQLSTTLEHIADHVEFIPMASAALSSDEGFTHAVKITEMLGEKMYPLVTEALTNARNMQERATLVEFLRKVGPAHFPLLVQELRKPHVWYVYRNLLQILHGNVTETELAIVSEKFTHPDPRVREEALIVAVDTAKCSAVPYLVTALRDESPEVRARAASLAGVCPQPAILEHLLRMLNTQVGKGEAENVKMAACLALRHFPEPAVQDVLLKILHPPLFSPYKKMTDEIRSVAVVALDSFIDVPAVQAALRRATTDAHMLVRQNAQQVWKKVQRGKG